MTHDDSTASPSRRLVLAVGHFPPPVHGMSVATERLVALISERAETRLLVISAVNNGGLMRHTTRLARSVGAIFRMSADRRRSDSLYMGSDAGLGMLYTLGLVLAGRILGYRIFLHHHSAAYVHERSRLMAAIVRCGDRRCTHVLSCACQASLFEDRYRPISSPMVLPICFSLAGLDQRSDPRPDRRELDPTLVLGHLSNLSVEKGLERVFQTLHRAIDAGLDVRLVLAGPAATERDEAVLSRLLTEAAGHVVYLGPVDEEGKQRFFDDIDVFLFPSRYRHESFGLVAAEAMQASKPVIAYRAGCLDSDFVGGAGIVLDPSEDYPTRAVDQMIRWTGHPEELQACSARASRRARSARDDAMATAAAFVEHLIDSGGNPPANLRSRSLRRRKGV